MTSRRPSQDPSGHFRFTDDEVLAARGPRNATDDSRPYHFLVEPEFSAAGCVEDVATVFLTNRECPFRCVMCDLWQNTTESTVPAGAIPAQIDYALERLPPASHLKLYNSGNFFDAKAIPRSDRPLIAQRAARFRSVIVENHPKLCGAVCAEFQQQCGTQLEVAMGLETADAELLAGLNKQMTTEDFACACETLLKDGIRIRAFILLRLPGQTEEQGVESALRAVRFAFDCGVDCCAVIPTRTGNGLIDQLLQQGLFESPRLTSLERVTAELLRERRGRVFADIWDAARFAECPVCCDERIERLQLMNLTQSVAPPVRCAACACG